VKRTAFPVGQLANAVKEDMRGHRTFKVDSVPRPKLTIIPQSA